MNTVPIARTFPVGVVGYAIAITRTKTLLCAFDPGQAQEKGLREQARSLVLAAGGDCQKCSVTCPFNLN